LVGLVVDRDQLFVILIQYVVIKVYILSICSV